LGPTLFWPYAKAILALESWIGTHGAILGMEESQIGRTLWVKAISDTVEHLVPRPLPARPRNSIWRQAKERSLNGILYILYFLLLIFDIFILFGW
jgi:hypothetical protein